MLSKDRLEFLVDGVIAIVLTMMVLEIQLPTIEESIDWYPLLFQICIYALSFAVIAIIWYNHYHLFTNVKHVHPSLTWLNLGLLFCISLIPLPTDELAKHFSNPDFHLLYGLILGFTSTIYTLIQLIVHSSVSHLEPKTKHKLNLKNWLTVISYFTASALCFISIYISLFIFAAIPLSFLIPSKSIVHHENN